MANQKAPKAYNTFVKGLMTEASPINHPDDYASDIDNVVLGLDGSLQRRAGMDYEASNTMSANILTTILEDDAVAELYWNSADNNPLNNFLIQQIGTTLYIHDINGASVGVHKDTVDLNTFSTGLTTTLGYNAIQGVSGKGAIFIVGHDIDPFYITYDTDSDTFTTSSAIEIKVRDFNGLDDTFKVNQIVPFAEPTWYTGADYQDDKDKHVYNLWNQGWWSDKITTYMASGTGDLPTNADMWLVAKDATDVFVKALLLKQDFGNGPAPSGHFVLNDFSRDRSFATLSADDDKVDTIYSVDYDMSSPTEVDAARPTTNIFYAGRIFYAGQVSSMTPVTASDNSGKIYFSPIIEELKEDVVGRCHQQYDPTSEHLPDLLPNDGGVIHIPGLGKVHKMEQLGNNILILSDAGAWVISGGTESGFVATGYIIDNVSTIGTVNAESVIRTKQGIFFWADNGIHLAAVDRNTGGVVVTDITDDTIQTYYDSIDPTARLYTKGEYDSVNKKVRWIFNDSSTYDGVSYRYKYNREVVLDLRLGAFYTNTIAELTTDSPYIAGFFPTPNLISSDQLFDVYVGTDIVQVNSGADDVQVTIEAAASGPSSLKYLCVEPQAGGTNSQYTYGLYRDPDFVDWLTADSTGKSYLSYIETGEDLAGDIVSTKQSPYVMFYFKRTETQFIDDGSGNVILDFPSSCLVQAKWDFADHSDSGKYSEQKEAYKLLRLKTPSGSTPQNINYGHDVIVTKSRIRGSGRSLKLRFESAEGKDFHLYGWVSLFTGTTEE